LRASRQEKPRQPKRVSLRARVCGPVRLEIDASGKAIARFEGYAIGLGTLSAAATVRARELRSGLPLESFAHGRVKTDKEIQLLVRRLAERGLLEYRFPRARGAGDLIVIEPQMPDYWPQTPQLRDDDRLVLSRFAYMRRRGNDLVLESPRADALFKIRDAKVVAAIALLSTPQKVRQLRRHDAFHGVELLALLLHSQILLKVDKGDGLRPAEGDSDLVLWDFHDLLFHARSTQGRHANPAGGVYPHDGVTPQLPPVRPLWPGEKIDLGRFPSAHAATSSPLAKLLRERHSTRSFDDQRPIAFAELAQFLDGTARVLARGTSSIDDAESSPVLEHAVRPYPSAGASYELELYLAVDKCEGLERGMYHYDAEGHVLVRIATRAPYFEALLREAQFAMGVSATPQIVITITARFGRVSWKYSSIAYSLILKDVGVLLQTFYLEAAALGLGGCAVGTTDIELFAKMTGLAFHAEGPVGQFVLGRGAKSEGLSPAHE
jgi:SagB-type dehydrogenase family enzyme